jgi:hypothetical protein
MRVTDLTAGFFNREIETLPLAATKDLQFRKLREMVRYAFAKNSAYRGP